VDIEVHEIMGRPAIEGDVPEVFPNSIFTSPAWLECFKTSNRTPLYLRFVAEGKTVGLIGGLKAQSPNLLIRKLYRPLVFFSGPSLVQPGPSLLMGCMEALQAFACRQGYSQLFFYSWDYPCCYDVPALPLRAHKRKEYIIDLRGGDQDIQKRVRRFVKQKAKRARNAGVTCRQGHSEKLVKELFALLDKTKQRRVDQGHTDYDHYYMPFLDDKIVAQLIDRRMAQLVYAQTSQEVLSMILLLTQGKRAYALLSGTSPTGYAIGANHLLWLYLIEKEKSEGVDMLNLGGVPGGAAEAGLIYYKLSLGAEEHLCMGGATKMLRGFLVNFNSLLGVYDKINREKVKQILGPRISESIKLVGKAWMA
jgi:hypothetical protein